MRQATIEAVLDQLPQTQCQLCAHQGCRPYAEAIVDGEDDISKCQPGGVAVLNALAKIMDVDPTPWQETVQTQHKVPSLVTIDPDLCIGCTKCIQACPVDAIIGRSKSMHGVIDTECTGCDLCIPACPMDCIYPVTRTMPTKTEQNQFRQRHEAKLKRDDRKHQEKQHQHQIRKQNIADTLKALQAKKR